MIVSRVPQATIVERLTGKRDEAHAAWRAAIGASEEVWALRAAWQAWSEALEIARGITDGEESNQ